MKLSKKCTNCGKKPTKDYYGLSYCRKCYLNEKFRTDDIIEYLDKNNMRYRPHSSHNNIITRKDRDLISFCTETKTKWWQDVNYDDTLHIEVPVEKWEELKSEY